ncbi:uncharacterized protein LOC131145931 [Malania oleifera]|uniref:uncharacterized protein LOC131145931 n=1 Tax=Malania oleifera TaxID=397392 RepID=UPI0025AE8036|nr:uncharacterized protein LOC131145931 [Malania oleifera]
METVMEEEDYSWREVKQPLLIPIVPELELERETGERRRCRDIVIAVDHGPNSKHTFDWALVHFCRLAHNIHLVHAFSNVESEVVYEMTKVLMEKLAVEALQVAMLYVEIIPQIGVAEDRQIEIFVEHYRSAEFGGMTAVDLNEGPESPFEPLTYEMPVCHTDEQYGCAEVPADLFAIANITLDEGMNITNDVNLEDKETYE